MEWGNIISRGIWALLQPSNSLVLLAVVGAFLLWRGYRKWGVWLSLVPLSCLILVGITPLGKWLAIPLENRFAAFRDLPRGDYAGILVLAGTERPSLSTVHDQPALTGRAERLIGGVKMARLFPQLPLIHSGGTGKKGEWTENDVARRVFEDVGLDLKKVYFENRSYNTYTNATESRELIRTQGLDKSGTWILVTSANHMPRAVGAFHAAGLRVRPYPVDFKTDLQYATFPKFAVAANLNDFDDVAHEWLGLVVYYLTGRSSSLFPGPDTLSVPPPPTELAVP